MLVIVKFTAYSCEFAKSQLRPPLSFAEIPIPTVSFPSSLSKPFRKTVNSFEKFKKTAINQPSKCIEFRLSYLQCRSAPIQAANPTTRFGENKT